MTCAGSQQEEMNSVTAETVKTWLEEGTQFKVLDVRSHAEFTFVGHPEGAYHLPFSFWDPTEGFQRNENFLTEVKERFAPDDTIVVICRSGGRSRAAVKMMSEAGFTSVWNLTNGYEGTVGPSGLRTVSGWRNSTLPSTYKSDPERGYPPKKAEAEEKQ
jgi:rhodanese-related sulfurtransferase